MKLIGCLLLFVVSAMSLEKPYYDVKDAPALFEKFIKDFHRHYKDEADKEVHYQEFVKSLKEINQDNAKSPLTVYDINDFADYTPEEWKRINGFKFPDKKKKH